MAVSNKHKMNVDMRIIERKSNQLSLIFDRAHYYEQEQRKMIFISPNYTCGLTRFKLRLDKDVDRFMIFVSCENAYDDDTSKYNCKVSSNTLNFSKSIFSEKGVYKYFCFHALSTPQIIQKEYTYDLKFDFKVEVDIEHGKGDFAALFDDAEFIDFELRASDGSVHMHKTVLSTASDVFYTMLKGVWKETEKAFINMENTNIEVLRHLKDYIYRNQLPAEYNQLKLLAELGCMYMMPEMVQKCCVKLLNMLSEENTMDLLEFSISGKITRLHHVIINLIIENVVKVHVIFADTKWG